MSKLIIVSGPTGSGKTYLAKYLSEATNIPYFCKDEIKEQLFDSMGWLDKEWSRKLGVAAIRLLFFLIEKELKAGRSIIAEANFKPKLDTVNVQKLVDLYHTEVLELHCHAPEEVLLNRAKGRVTSGERHPGHVDTFLEDRYFDLDQHEAIGVGSVCEVDTVDFAKVNYQLLVDRVASFVS